MPDVEQSYWVSWFHTEDMGGFELDWPWWTSGYRLSDGAATLCAAVRAKDSMGVMIRITGAYDVYPGEVEWRFIEHKPQGWEPFGDRFPRADWMEW